MAKRKSIVWQLLKNPIVQGLLLDLAANVEASYRDRRKAQGKGAKTGAPLSDFLRRKMRVPGEGQARKGSTYRQADSSLEKDDSVKETIDI